jgi:uncharacterized phage protein (TIGR01671 family)
MREIKFRGWDGKEIRRVLSVEWLDEVYVTYWDNQGVASADEVLMQYTGLKDKNGVEIYEGDILHLEEKRYEKLSDVSKQFATNEDKAVSFEGGAFRFDGITLGDLIPSNYLSAEITGNIYSDPHLLTNEEK